MTDHIPVLLKETISGLNLKKGDVVIDGTINVGGHSIEIAKLIGKEGYIIGIDQDSDALCLAQKNLEKIESKLALLRGNYRDMDILLQETGIVSVHAILLDIGLSNRQLTDSGRGFSFAKDEPLLMTFNPHPKEDELTAYEILNTWDEENIADIIYGYGGERFSRRIAKNVVEARKESPIRRTFQLVEIVNRSIPFWYKKKSRNPATKTFQALRITVNDELGALKTGIEKAVALLKKDGRLAIITFHSGEDRIVKKTFRDLAQQQIVEIVNKKPIVPSEEELSNNPKARSAKLRIVQKAHDQIEIA